MADIELVIKIDEGVYNEVCRKGLALYSKDHPNIEKAIKNGTLLLKGHGKLIDANTVNKSVKDPYQNREVMYWINNAPTILKAEREEV